MGVPSLFRNIVEYDPKAYTWDPHAKTDHLYFDFNNLIHFCRGKNPHFNEEELITEVVRYSTYITTKVIKPNKVVYLSFDGPVPYGKMIRQRARRHKKVQDTAYLKKIHLQNNVEYKESFDSNIITPGTSFMTKLSSRLRNFVSIGAFNRHVPKDSKFNVIISDSSVPGEGEHKIFQFLKNSKEHSKCVIYGMDADLIILSMECYKTNIRLLREFDEDDTQFRTLDIDACKKALLHINELQDDKYDEKCIIRDFVYFSFFGGNDFVPAFPSLSIKDGGLSFLFKSYKQLLDNYEIDGRLTYLMNPDGVPNPEILYEFIKILEEYETVSVRKKMKRIKFRSVGNNNGISHKMTPEEKIKVLMSNYEHSYYLSPANPFNNYYKDEFDLIDYESDDWISQYNNYFFKDVELETVCNDYLTVLKWCFDYYTNNEPPSWYFAYTHRTAPPLQTFMVHGDFEKKSNFNYKQLYVLPPGITDDTPMTPYEQMLMILPIQNMNLLPGPFKCFVLDPDAPLHFMYKRNFKLDVMVGYKNIYSEPLLDDVDFEKVKMVINNVLLNDMEWSRNIIRTGPFKRTFGKSQNITSQ